MSDRIAALPNELVGLILTKTRAGDAKNIPHAFRLASISYLGIKAGALPTFSLNANHCAKRYGISRSTFQKGIRHLKEVGALIARTSTGKRRLSVDTYRSFGAHFVPVPERLLLEPPRVLAMYVLARLRPMPRERDRLCREFGTTAPNTQKRVLDRLRELGLVRAGDNTPSALVTARSDSLLNRAQSTIKMRAAKSATFKFEPSDLIKKQPTQETSPQYHHQDCCGISQVLAGEEAAAAEKWPDSLYVALAEVADGYLKLARDRRFALDETALRSEAQLHQLGALLSATDTSALLMACIKQRSSKKEVRRWLDFVPRGYSGVKLAKSSSRRKQAPSLQLRYLDSADLGEGLPPALRLDHEGLTEFLNANCQLPLAARDLFGIPTFEEALDAMAEELRSTKLKLTTWNVFLPCLERLKTRAAAFPAANGFAEWRISALESRAVNEQRLERDHSANTVGTRV